MLRAGERFSSSKQPIAEPGKTFHETVGKVKAENFVSFRFNRGDLIGFKNVHPAVRVEKSQPDVSCVRCKCRPRLRHRFRYHQQFRAQKVKTVSGLFVQGYWQRSYICTTCKIPHVRTAVQGERNALALYLTSELGPFLKAGN